MAEQIRLDKCLASLGLGTRTEVKQLIRKGQVLLDGKACKDPSQKFPAEETEISVSGTKYTYKAVRTLMMNKAAGVLTAARDLHQKTVMDVLPPLYKAMGSMPVGRLDKDTEGMLILTNDGDLAHRLISPDKDVGKVYVATLDGVFSEADAKAFEDGLEIKDADGAFLAKPAKVRKCQMVDSRSIVEVMVTEGKYHQVKRMFAMRGLQVVGLKRIQIGELALDPALGPGEYRELDAEECLALERQG